MSDAHKLSHAGFPAGSGLSLTPVLPTSALCPLSDAPMFIRITNTYASVSALTPRTHLDQDQEECLRAQQGPGGEGQGREGQHSVPRVATFPPLLPTLRPFLTCLATRYHHT